ncbi:MAG: hypothetical protein ACK505_04040 [Flavobacteriales bacterium]|jgi:hypothetical protein
MTETIRKTLGASLSETASLLLLSTSMVGAIEQRAKFPGDEASTLIQLLNEQIKARLAQKPGREELKNLYCPPASQSSEIEATLAKYRKKLLTLRKREQKLLQQLDALLVSIYVGETLSIPNSISHAPHRRKTLAALHQRQLLRLNEFPMDQLRIIQAEIEGVERVVGNVRGEWQLF